MKSGGTNTIDKNNPAAAHRNTLDLIQIPENLKDAFASLRSVSENEAVQWADINNAIIENGSGQEIDRLARLNDLIGPLSSGPASMLIWQKLKHPHTSQTLIAADVHQRPAPAMRQIRVSRFNEVMDLREPENFTLSGDRVFTTVHRNDFIWTIMQDSSPLTTSASEGEETNERALFIPSDFFKKNKELLAAANVDTAILLRSVLEELGFYKTTALFIPKIRVLGKQGTSSSDGIFFGFKVEPLQSDEWMNLPDISFAILPAVRMLSPQTAFRALKNLRRMAETFKRLGITMNSWAGFMVNVKTGEISLGEGDRPILLNSMRLSTALAQFLNAPELYTDKDNLPYFPNLASVSLGQTLSSAERQLINIMIFLRRVSGKSSIQPTNEHLLAQIMNDFSLYLDMANDKSLIKALADNKDTVRAIVEHYLDQFRIDIDMPDFKGILNFMTHILPGIMIVSRPEEWFIKASKYIEAAKAAHLDGERNVEVFWEKVSKSLWKEITLLRTKNTSGGGRGGSPTQTPGSDINMGGSGGGHIAQAGGTDVMHPPVGWVASSAQQLPVQAMVPSAVPVVSSAPVMQGGLMFFGVPPITLIH